MSGERWGPDGPPEEAYSRITRDLATLYAPVIEWASEHLPECGCDACDETAEALLDMLAEARDLVVAGFAEWIRLRGDGQWWLGHGTAIGHQGRSVDHAELRELGISAPIELAWRPWTQR